MATSKKATAKKVADPCKSCRFTYDPKNAICKSCVNKKDKQNGKN